MTQVETRLLEAGLEIPNASAPVANYVLAVQTGKLVFISGQGPTRDGKPVYQGVVGVTISEEDAYQAARLCALNSLAALKHEISDLDRVKRVIKMLGFVASAPEFERQPFVINGASDLLALAFGDAGRHARSAIGTSNLPFNIPVEVEIIVELASKGQGLA